VINSDLPMNMLNVNVTLPYATIDTISLNCNPYLAIPKFVNQADECSVYQASFNVDTAGNKFFDQQISNYDMYISFSFNYDPEIVSKTTFSNEPDTTNDLLNE
jgi:hypothetical protein